MRLIDADALIAEWCEGCKYLETDLCDQDICGGVLLMKEAPTIEAEPVNPWVNIAQEKPLCRGHYFIAYKFQGSDMQFFGEAFWHDDIPTNGYVNGDHFSNEGVEGMYVTHWMKIPKLPQLRCSHDLTTTTERRRISHDSGN